MTIKAGAWGFLGWLIVALILLPIVWGVAQAARVFPGEGGFYHYCKTGLSETAGFLANWAYLIGYLGTAATLISIIKNTLIQSGTLPTTASALLLFNISAVIILSLLNLMSVTLISKIQSFTTVLKIIPLVFILALVFFYWNPAIAYNAADFSNILYTLPFATFGYFGFESCCIISHYIEGGPTRASKVILLGFFIAALLYCVFHLGAMHIMGIANLKALGASAFPQFLGWSPRLTAAIQAAISFAIMVSFINTAYGASFTNIMNVHGLAKRNVIWGSSFLKTTFGKTQIPVMTTLVHAIVVFALVTFINSPQILPAFTCLGIVTSFILVELAVLRYFSQKKNILQCAIATLGLISCAILIYFSWAGMGDTNAIRLMYASPVLIGLAFGYIMFKTKQQPQLTK